MTVVSSKDVADAPNVVSVVSPPDVVPVATVNPVSAEPPLAGRFHESATLLGAPVAVSTGALGAVGPRNPMFSNRFGEPVPAFVDLPDASRRW